MQAGQRLKVFLLAGIKTSPSAFHVLQQRLHQQLEEKGYIPDIEMLFPYGEMKRNVVIQVMEVRADLSKYVYRGGIGGRKVWNRVQRHGREQKLLLIGHSGGGVAAYQIARKIHKDRLPVDTRVIQIGSPKTRIIPPMKEKVSYIHSVDDYGVSNDRVTKLGNWGGWSRPSHSQQRLPLPHWDATKYAPGRIVGVSTLGGHADYFRHSAQFTDAYGCCNLDKTLDKVEESLREWLPKVSYLESELYENAQVAQL